MAVSQVLNTGPDGQLGLGGADESAGGERVDAPSASPGAATSKLFTITEWGDQAAHVDVISSIAEKVKDAIAAEEEEEDDDGLGPKDDG